MPELWERQPYDTDRSWQAFQGYCELGISRSLSKLLSQYVHQSSNGSPPPSTKRNTLANWSERHNWVERAKAWDAKEELRDLQAREKARESEQLEKIENFRRLHENAGVSGFNAVVRGKAILNVYLEKYFTKEQKPIKEVIQGLTLEDISKISRIVQSLESASSEVWANALGITTLLEQVNATEGE